MLDPYGSLGLVPKHVDSADTLGTNVFRNWPESNKIKYAISCSTLRVCGLRDPGIGGHKKLYWLYVYAKPGTATLVERGGDHRIPLKTKQGLVETKYGKADPV